MPGQRSRSLATTSARPAPRVRAAIPDDAAALTALRYEFRVSEAPGVECEQKFGARCTTWMRERLGNPRSAWRCWVGEADGALIATLWLQVIEKLPNPVEEPERHAYITSVYVRPGHRNRGLGTRLLETALAWTREQDVDSVFLWRTEASESLYQRHDFTGSRLLVERRQRGDAMG